MVNSHSIRVDKEMIDLMMGSNLQLYLSNHPEAKKPTIGAMFRIQTIFYRDAEVTLLSPTNWGAENGRRTKRK